MSNENIIRAIAGTFIIVSLIMSRVHTEYWLFFTAFVGFNLLQSSFTRFCPMEKFLIKMRGQ